MTTPRIKVKVGGKTLEVPVFKNAPATQRIAEALDQRLKAIEAASGRIDTHAFALEAAFALAVEAQALTESADADRVATLKELDRLQKSVEKLIREFRPAS